MDLRCNIVVRTLNAGLERCTVVRKKGKERVLIGSNSHEGKQQSQRVDAPVVPRAGP